MKAWISNNLSDEEGGSLASGKAVIIHGTRAEVRAIARFMAQVEEHLEDANYCHMHLRDSMDGWSEADHIDIEVTVDERTA